MQNSIVNVHLMSSVVVVIHNFGDTTIVATQVERGLRAECFRYVSIIVGLKAACEWEHLSFVCGTEVGSWEGETTPIVVSG